MARLGVDRVGALPRDVGGAWRGKEVRLRAEIGSHERHVASLRREIGSHERRVASMRREIGTGAPADCERLQRTSLRHVLSLRPTRLGPFTAASVSSAGAYQPSTHDVPHPQLVVAFSPNVGFVDVARVELLGQDDPANRSIGLATPGGVPDI